MITHEPECPTGKDWYEMCECETLRSAYRRGREDEKAAWMSLKQIAAWLAAHDAKVYQRGREDAAKAVEAEPDTATIGSAVFVDRDAAIAAARGDGAA